MASTSRWRLRARRALGDAMVVGATKGLHGAALKTYVRAHGYPFGLRENTPYKIWLEEARKLLGPTNPTQINGRKWEEARAEPIRVMSLSEVTTGSQWVGRVMLGDWIQIQFLSGHLLVKVAEVSRDLPHSGFLYRERIAEEAANVCDLREVIEILEGTGAFDFSAINPGSFSR